MRRHLHSIAVAFALVVVAEGRPGWAGFDEGKAAAERGDYATALREWQPLAESGDPAAENAIGVLYANGWGVNQNPTEAARWFRKAADHDFAQAQSNLAFAYQNGDGVRQDYDEAVKWYLKAA